MIRNLIPLRSSSPLMFKGPEPAQPKMFVQRYREPRGYPGPQTSFKSYLKAMQVEKFVNIKKEIEVKNESMDDLPLFLPIRNKGDVVGADASGCKRVEAFQPVVFPFNRLPQELRDMIWKLALPVEPRIVQVNTLWLAKVQKPKIEHKFNLRSRKSDKDSVEIRDNYEYAVSKATTDVPVLLHVCKESRKVALSIYKLSFARQLGGKPIYMNLNVDSLYFEAWQFFFDFAAGSTASAYRKDVVGKLKHLIIGGHLCGYHRPDTTYTHKQLGWDMLKTLILEDAWCTEHAVAAIELSWKKEKGEDAQLPEIKLFTDHEFEALLGLEC